MTPQSLLSGVSGFSQVSEGGLESFLLAGLPAADITWNVTHTGLPCVSNPRAPNWLIVCSQVELCILAALSHGEQLSLLASQV